MSEHEDRLLEILAQHREHSEKLLTLSTVKREAILENDTDGINTVMLDEMQHISAIRKLEEDRKQTVEALGNRMGTRRIARLDDIIARIGDEEAQALSAARDSLRDVLGELQKSNARNQTLLESSMEHFNGFFNALRSVRADRPVYNNRGASSKNGRPLINRTA